MIWKSTNRLSAPADAGLLAAALAATLLLPGCDRQNGSGDLEFRVPVTVEEVGTATVEDRIVATGTLRATELVSLQVETGGFLEIARNDSGRRFGEGDPVKVGDVIARITGEAVRVAAGIEASRQKFEAAHTEYESIRKLYDEGAANKTDLSNAKSALEDARLAYDKSRNSETRSQLVTPIDGVILRLARDPQGQPFADGQFVVPGMEIVQIAPPGRLIAEVNLVGPDMARVTAGLTARIRHYAWDDQSFSGTVTRLAPMIDSVTRAMRAEVEVENPGNLLRPGMYVEVTIIGEKREGVPVVPWEAVANRGGKRVVFVLKGQRVARREVTLGLRDDEIVEIREGLTAGERVITRGLETLTDQTRVRVQGSS